MNKVILQDPIWIYHHIIYNIRYDEAVPIFLPVLLVAPTVFLQIARDENEDDHRQCLEIPIVEPLLRLGQMAEHYATNGECFGPIYSVDSLFHATKLHFSHETAKSSNFFLYFCR